MLDNNKGRVVGVNGNMLTVEFDTKVTQNEVAYVRVGNESLKCEVIRVRGNRADMQVFESTNGLSVGDEVDFTDELLSVELGPGLLSQVYDGLQNPLNLLAEQSGFFLQRGVYLSGGGAQLEGLRERLSDMLNLNVIVNENPQDHVARGCCIAAGDARLSQKLVQTGCLIEL